MGFFSTDHASNGASTKGLKKKQKAEIAQLTREVKRRERMIAAKKKREAQPGKKKSSWW